MAEIIFCSEQENFGNHTKKACRGGGVVVVLRGEKKAEKSNN